MSKPTSLASLVDNLANLNTGAASGSNMVGHNGSTVYSVLAALQVAAINRASQIFTATASQTSFTVSGGYTPSLVQVFANGIKLTVQDFTATDGSTIVLNKVRNAGDTIEVIPATPLTVANAVAPADLSNNSNSSLGAGLVGYNGTTVASALASIQASLTTTGSTPLTSTSFTCTDGQTTFTINYTPNLVQVFANGAKLPPADFTATDGANITLNTARSVNDIVEIVPFAPFTVANGGFSASTVVVNGNLAVTTNTGIVVYIPCYKPS